MAQIINKKNPLIITSTRTRGYCSVTIKEKGIYITKQVALLCGLKVDQFVHFINDSNYWAFYVNEDPDGFAVSRDHANGGFVLYNRQLSKMFRTSTRAAINDRFLIISSNARHNGSTLYEIITSASVDVVINRRKRMMEQRQILREYMDKQNAAC